MFNRTDSYFIALGLVFAFIVHGVYLEMTSVSAPTTEPLHRSSTMLVVCWDIEWVDKNCKADNVLWLRGVMRTEYNRKSLAELIEKTTGHQVDTEALFNYMGTDEPIPIVKR